MPESLQKKTLKGLAWSLIERLSVQGTQFVVMVIMARILSPRDYGLVGMIAVFIIISQVLVDGGMSQALIRKQKRTETDNATAFTYNISVGVLIYLILFICAPWIADFYGEPQLVLMTRLLGLNIIINSSMVVQKALLMAKIKFRLLTISAFLATLLSGIVGIAMAYIGYGVWSIVAQQMLNMVANAVLLWGLSEWHPCERVSWDAFKGLFGFGSNLLISGIISTLYSNLFSILIGKKFTATTLGYYTRALQFTNFPSAQLSNVVQRVTYPVLCQMQDDDRQLRSIYRRILSTTGFLLFPLMTGLGAVAVPLILLLLKEQWIFVATILPILCLNLMWCPIHILNLNMLQVKGRSDLYLRIEIIKRILGLIMIAVTIPHGILAMCWGTVVISIIGLVINAYYTGKLVNVGFFVQMRDLLPSVMLSLAMAVCVYVVVNLAPCGNLVKLLCGIVTGMVVYVLGAYLFRFKEIRYIMELKKLITVGKK